MRRNARYGLRGTRAFLGLLCATFCLPLTAATSRQTELAQAVAQAGAADKSRLLVELSAEIETDDMNRAWDYAQQARQIAATPADEIRADTRLAALQRRRGSYREALATAQAALARATQLNDDQLRAEAMLIVANTYDSLADFPAALDLFSTLTPLAEKLGDATLLCRVYNTLGVTYADANQPDRARQAYETSLGHATRSGRPRLISSLLNNLGNMAVEAGNGPLARDYHQKALALRESAGGDTRGIADSNQNLGEVAILEGRPAEALPYLDRAIALHTSLGLKRNLANAQLTYATALRLLGRLDESLPHLQAALQFAEELKSQTILARVYRAFALYHEARGQYQAALDFERKLATSTDAAIGERSRQRLDTLQARYDAERRQHEIDILRRDQQLQDAALATARWQRYSLAVILAGVTAVAVAIISRQRLKQRTEARIHAETRAGREAAETAHALKTRLLHITSHDIRGPLANVLHVTQELQADLPRDRTDDRLDIIKHEAENVLHLAQDILDSAALEKGSLALQPAPTDLAEIIRSVVERLQWRATLKDQVIEFTPVAPETGIVEGDALRLKQVLTNLVSNALKYSPPRKPIRVRLERDDRVVRVSVIDEGPGISAKDRLRLFTPFNRLHNRPADGESSHGLGLSIAHELVRLHGGQLTVESTVGHGSTFIVSIPVTPGTGSPPENLAANSSVLPATR